MNFVVNVKVAFHYLCHKCQNDIIFVNIASAKIPKVLGNIALLLQKDRIPTM